MLIRICLIVAIVAGLAAAGFNFLTVKDKITETIAQRDQNAQDRDTARTQAKTAEKLAKETQNKLEATNAVLTATMEERDTAVANSAAQQKRADTLADTLKKTQSDLDNTQNELAAWHALGIPVDQIKATLLSLRDLTEERDAILAEKKILVQNNHKLQAKLDQFLDPDHAPDLPAGLKGKVLVADPRYDFVVLDIGDKQGLLENGQLLVNRNGKLIAKIKVKSIEGDRSIANVMPGWKLGDIMEGDQVFY